MTGTAAGRRRVDLVGHRGAAGVAPENTLPSFEAAWAAGVAWVETDVRLTRDGVPVLIHDSTLDRTTTGSGPVSAATWEEIRHLDAGIRFAPDLAGTRVLRLEELLAARVPITHCVGTRRGRSRILIELKAESERAELLVERVLAAVEAAKGIDRVRLISFDAELLERATRAASHRPFSTGLIASQAAGLVEAAARLGCAAIHPGLGALSPGLVVDAHATGLRVNTWTANTREQVRRAIELGVDEITSDFPVVAREALVSAE